jgi:sulfate transport system ATP-binding protein
VNRVGDAFVRPHDVELSREPSDDATAATVERIVHLGFEVRVELRLADGEDLWAQLTREEADDLEQGARVYVRSRRERVFAEA